MASADGGLTRGRAARAPRSVPFTNIGPYFVRRESFGALGGFTTAYGGAGEPGGHFDAELCLRAWLDGRYTCGLYYGRVGNGVGGHKTRVGAQARLRRRNQHTAIADLRAKWAVHNATIAQRLNAENGQLLAFARRGDGALRLQRARRESQESCGGKKG